MALSLQEVSDRIEINDLLVAYCTAVDSQTIDDFDNIFTPDALIDYTELGGIRGSREEIKAYLKKVLPLFKSAQHMIANSQVWLEGDSARARTMLHNPMEIPLQDGTHQVAFYGLWYNDRLVRTEAGWRICERIEEYCYDFNVPHEFKPIK